MKWLLGLLVGIGVTTLAVTSASTYYDYQAKSSERAQMKILTDRVQRLEDERKDLQAKLKATDEFCDKVMKTLGGIPWKTKTP